MRGHVLASRSWRLRRHLRAVEHLSSLASRPGRRRTSADDRAQEVGAGSPSRVSLARTGDYLLCSRPARMT